MNRVRCFFLAETDQIEMRLRRFVFSSKAKCPGRYGYHNADVSIGRDLKTNSTELHGDSWPHADPRWPKKCEFCDFVFRADDQWQFNPDALYRRSDDGDLVTLNAAPVGAMWNAYWLRDAYGYRVGADGIILAVRTPAGDWVIDGPAYGEGKATPNAWTRNGTIPDVTANPSIHFPGQYHGFLRAGYLEEC